MKNSHRFLTLALLKVIFITGLYAQLPANRVIDWSGKGVTGGIPLYNTQYNFLNYGGVADGVTDNSDSLQKLINTVAGTQSVIYFPPGNYRFNDSITIPRSGKILLKGAGADSSFFKFYTGNLNFFGDFNIAKGYANLPLQVLGGYKKDSTILLLASVAGLNAGDFVIIDQDNDLSVMHTVTPPETDTMPDARRTVGQLMKITAVNGNKITIDRPLHYTYNPAMNVQLREVRATEGVGFEDFSIENMVAGDKHNFLFIYSFDCWVKCIKSIKTVSCHVNLNASCNVTIRDSYFYSSWYNGPGGHGYGIALTTKSTDCLIENNIYRHLRHSMLTARGANGNVVAYNYSLEDTSHNFGPLYLAASLSLHGYFPYTNLYEGNIVKQIHSADWYGPSGPSNTFFRNRVYYQWLKISDRSIEQNVLGNELNNFQNFNENKIIDDTSCINTIIHGNNDNGNIVWDTAALGVNNLQNSYYLSVKPPFWGNATWPNMGPEYVLGSGSIPAKLRFEAGFYTQCEYENYLEIKEQSYNSILSVFPNPTEKSITITAPFKMQEVQLISLKGELVQSLYAGGQKSVELNLFQLPPAIYIAKVIGANTVLYSKVIKQE